MENRSTIDYGGVQIPRIQAWGPATLEDIVAFRPACSQVQQARRGDETTHFITMDSDGQAIALATYPSMDIVNAQRYLNDAGLCKLGGVNVPLIYVDQVPQRNIAQVEANLSTRVEQGVETGVEQGVETGVEQGVETGVEQGVEDSGFPRVEGIPTGVATPSTPSPGNSSTPSGISPLLLFVGVVVAAATVVVVFRSRKSPEGFDQTDLFNDSDSEISSKEARINELFRK